MKLTKLKSKSALQIGRSKNVESGFILIAFLFLLPLVLSGIYIFTSAVQIAQTKTQLESVCLKLQNQSFYRQRQRLIKLLNLNPTAQRLILVKTQIQLKIAAALAAGQLELIPLLEAKREKIIIRQQKLAEKQNALLMQAHEEFQHQQLNIMKMLNKAQTSIRRESAKIWFIHFSPLQYNFPHLAVQTIIPDIAPVYDLELDFENQQSWRIHWIMKIKLNPQLFAFLNFSHEVQHQCLMSMKAQRNTFPIVVLDKS